MIQEIRKHAQLDETQIIAKHPSGLEIILMPKPGYQSAHASFFVNYGSIHNRYSAENKIWDMPEGIAHFLEHKIFESAKDNIFSVFASREASVNAYTNFVSTCYHFTGTSEFEANLKELLQFVQVPHITEENVEKEKGIIAQEIKMYQDNPEWRIYFNMLKSLYHKHPVRTDIAGTVESIETITAENLLRAYGHWYTPKGMKVFAIGDMDTDRALESISEVLLPEFLERNVVASAVPVEEPVKVFKALWEETFPVPTPNFFIGFKDQGDTRGHEAIQQYASASILMDILFGRSSELYQRLMEKELINSSYGMEYSCEAGYAHGIIGSESENPEKAWEEVDTFLKTEAFSFLSEAEVERVKRKTIGRFLQACNSIESLARVSVGFMNRGMNVFDYYDILQNLDVKQVKERFEILTSPERRSMSIIRDKHR